MTERSSPEYLRDGLADGRFQAVHTLHDHFEMDLVEQALDDAAIPHAIRMFAETEFALLFADAQGFGVVLVRSEDADRARTAIQAVRDSDAEAAETVRQMFAQQGESEDPGAAEE